MKESTRFLHSFRRRHSAGSALTYALKRIPTRGQGKLPSSRFGGPFFLSLEELSGNERGRYIRTRLCMKSGVLRHICIGQRCHTTRLLSAYDTARRLLTLASGAVSVLPDNFCLHHASYLIISSHACISVAPGALRITLAAWFTSR